MKNNYGYKMKLFIPFLCSLRLCGTFCNTAPDVWGSEELACDGIVIDMDYSPTR